MRRREGFEEYQADKRMSYEEWKAEKSANIRELKAQHATEARRQIRREAEKKQKNETAFVRWCSEKGELERRLHIEEEEQRRLQREAKEAMLQRAELQNAAKAQYLKKWSSEKLKGMQEERRCASVEVEAQREELGKKKEGARSAFEKWDGKKKRILDKGVNRKMAKEQEVAVKTEVRRCESAKMYREWVDEDKVRDKAERPSSKSTVSRPSNAVVSNSVLSRLNLASDGTLLAKEAQRLSTPKRAKRADDFFSAYLHTRDEEDAHARKARKEDKKKLIQQREKYLKQKWGKKDVVLSYSTSSRKAMSVPVPTAARASVVARSCWVAEKGGEATGNVVALNQWFKLRERTRIGSEAGALLVGRWKLLRAGDEAGHAGQQHVRSGQQVMIVFEASEGDDSNAGHGEEIDDGTNKITGNSTKTPKSVEEPMLLCCAGHGFWRVLTIDGARLKYLRCKHNLYLLVHIAHSPHHIANSPICRRKKCTQVRPIVPTDECAARKIANVALQWEYAARPHESTIYFPRKGSARSPRSA
jgi:hypothetical protein